MVPPVDSRGGSPFRPPRALTAAVALGLVFVLLSLGTAPVQATGASSNASATDTSVLSVAPGPDQSPIPLSQYDDSNPGALESGTTYWQGWDVTFDGTAIIESVESASVQDRTFELRRVTSDNRVGDRLTTFTVDQDGQATITTEPLVGRVVIVYQSEVVYVANGIGYVSTAPDGTTPSVSTSAWSVIEQELGATWSSQAVYDGEHTQITLTSNRDEFTVGVSSSTALTFTNLTQIFPEASYAPDYAARKNDSVLLLDGSALSETTLNFTGIAPDTYRLAFDATDTTGHTTTAIVVKQPNENAYIRHVDRSKPTGDLLTVTVACGQCYLVIGGADDGIIDLLELRDQTDDGEVTVMVNTRYAGLDRGGPGAPTGIQAYTAGDDSLTVFRSSQTLATGRTLGNVRSDLGLSASGSDAPLSPGTYDLTVSTTTHLRAHPPVESTVLRMRDTADVTTIELTDPAVSGIESSIGPPGLPRDLSAEDLPDRASPRDEVVLGDQLILRIDGTGLYGYLEAEGNGEITALQRNQNEGLALRIDGERSIINPETSRARLISDPANNRLYLVVDTRYLRGDQRPVTTGQSFTATFTLTGIDADRSRYSVYPPEDNYRGYPYLSPGETVTVQSTFRLLDPAGTTSISNLDSGQLRVPDQSGVPIEGTTKLAPRSRFTIRAASAESNGWATEAVATVQSDGTWSTTLDFSAARPGQEFSVTAIRNADQLTNASGVVVDASEFQTPVQSTATPTPSSPDDPEQGPASGGAGDRYGIADLVPDLPTLEVLLDRILGVLGFTTFTGHRLYVYG